MLVWPCLRALYAKTPCVLVHVCSCLNDIVVWDSGERLLDPTGGMSHSQPRAIAPVLSQQPVRSQCLLTP